MEVTICGTGLFAPGLHDWQSGRAVLRGQSPYEPDEVPVFDAGLLPPNERRRATYTARLALRVAQEAMASAPISTPADLSSVFACSGGDTESLDRICSALTLPGKPVSPNLFHNSVHNAPAGYWAIAAGSTAPSTSLSAYDSTFAAGLLDAFSLVAAMNQATLLVAYDIPPPKSLFPFRPLVAPFAVAFVVCPATMEHKGVALRVTIARDAQEDRMPEHGLERLRVGNPAARSLPMLAAIAMGGESTVVLPYLPESQLVVELMPC